MSLENKNNRKELDIFGLFGGGISQILGAKVKRFPSSKQKT
jgi:hypothetical protein